MKKLLLASLMLCSMANSSASIFAAGVDNSPPSESSRPVKKTVIPYASQGYGSQTISGQNMSYTFSVTKAMPEWRTWIQNTSSYEIKVTITKGSATGAVQWSGTVLAYTTYNVWSNYSYAADTYYVNFTSGSGDMSGSVAARIASTHNEILP